MSVYLVSDQKVLLIKHKRLGIWLPVGGEVETNETPIEAARREVREETGQVDIAFIDRRVNGFPVFGEPVGFIGYEEHPCGSKGLHMCFSFAAHVTTREIVSDGSFTDAQWFTANEVTALGDLSTPSVQQLVRRALYHATAVRR